MSGIPDPFLPVTPAEKWEDLYICGTGQSVSAPATLYNSINTITTPNGVILNIQATTANTAADAGVVIFPASGQPLKQMYSPHRELHEAKSAMERDTHNELRIVRRLRSVSPAFKRAQAVKHVHDLAVAVATAHKIGGKAEWPSHDTNSVDELFRHYALTMLHDFN